MLKDFAVVAVVLINVGPYMMAKPSIQERRRRAQRRMVAPYLTDETETEVRR